MALVAADWSITRGATIDIRYIGDDHDGASPSYATVLEFHRWLQDLADDASSSGDDELDITDTDPSARSTDNIITLKGVYNIDDTAAEHLYDGSIKQTPAGGEEIYSGFVNFGNVQRITIVQNGVRLTDDWWNLNSGAGGVNADSNAGISHRFLLKTKTAGALIDNGRIVALSRRFGYTYSEFEVSSAGEGNNVLALSEVVDINNSTAVGTVTGWTITNTEGYQLLDVDANGSNEAYYSQWNRGTQSINDLYEYTKAESRESITNTDGTVVDNNTSTLYGLEGEIFRGITHEIAYTGLTGTFDEGNPVTWATGSGQVLADNGTDKLWIQLLTGLAPGGSVALSQTAPDAASATTNGAAVKKTVSPAFIGTSTGSALIGAFGIGAVPSTLTNNDTLTDLGGNTVSPPNNVTFTVGGLVSDEDRVLVAPASGGSDANGDPEIQANQFTIATALSAANITSVVVNTTIPSDTPSAGTIRVFDNNGFARRLEYTSYTGATFTIDPAASEAHDATTSTAADFDTVGANIGNNVYISYIDDLVANPDTSLSFTAVYSTDRDLVVLVRDGGTAAKNDTPIKQFISSATFSSANTTVTAIRTSDL
jgi:hypothetical protein